MQVKRNGAVMHVSFICQRDQSLPLEPWQKLEEASTQNGGGWRAEKSPGAPGWISHLMEQCSPLPNPMGILATWELNLMQYTKLFSRKQQQALSQNLRRNYQTNVCVKLHGARRNEPIPCIRSILLNESNKPDAPEGTRAKVTESVLSVYFQPSVGWPEQS